MGRARYRHGRLRGGAKLVALVLGAIVVTSAGRAGSFTVGTLPRPTGTDIASTANGRSVEVTGGIGNGGGGPGGP